MGFLRFFEVLIFLTVVVVGAIGSDEKGVYVRFVQTPPRWSRSSIAVFRYKVQRPDGSDACKKEQCSFLCQLNGQILRQCRTSLLVLRNLTLNQEHTFLVNVKTSSREMNSSAYSWFIDTIPPTATISSQQNYTNAKKVSIDVTLSELCTGNGGFKCQNASHCDVIANGPSYVDASSLQILKPNTKYRLDVILSSKSLYERVVVTMKDRFCTDMAGNKFTRNNDSILVVHFDRRPELVDLWASVPSHKLGINGVTRTVFATNKRNGLKIFLNFSIPVVNSTEQILDALAVSSGILVPSQDCGNRNRWFGFELENVPKTKVITVELRAGKIIARTGAPVPAAAPLTFLYDSVRPEVVLSTSSPLVTKELSIDVIIEFTKPVFGFEASMLEVSGGRLARFKELSRALYYIIVLAATQGDVSIRVPAEKVKDVSGNPNLASNKLEVKHYLKPLVSAALQSFVTTGTLATSIASVVLSLSAGNLEAIGALHSSSTDIGVFDPSNNLHGMIGHLQVFVLADWFLPISPVEYSGTMRGLRWLIPHKKLPWKKESRLFSAGRFDSAGEKLANESNIIGLQIDSNSTEPSYTQHKGVFRVHGFDEFYRKGKSSKESSNNLPLSSGEYFTYFLRGEPLSAKNVIQKLENYKGWEDLEMNVFWLGVAGASFLIVCVLASLFLRYRIGTSALGILSMPRFELLFSILMLPCLSQASSFLIRGGMVWGIVVGAFVLAIPAAFVLSVCLFLVIGVFSGSFLVYREVRYVTEEVPWYKKLSSFMIGQKTTGKWSFREGLHSSIVSNFSILFDNHKGPPVYICVRQNGLRIGTESDPNRVKEDIKVSVLSRVTGCARSFYIVIDLTRRVGLGFISGISRSHKFSRTLSAVIVTSTQLVCLLVLRPYTRRGVQAVETISLLCELALFGLSVSTSGSKWFKEDAKLAFVMLSLFFVALIAHLANSWYSLLNFILKLSNQLENTSIRLGSKFALKGFLLPCLPRSCWAGSFELKMDCEARDGNRGLQVESFRAMTAAVVPLHSPDSPTPNAAGETSRAKRMTKVQSKSEMKKLRELAKASFAQDLSFSKGASTSIPKN